MTLNDPKGMSGRSIIPRDPEHADKVDTVPKDRLCDCCGGKDQRNYEPLRYRPKLKLWLCESCRELYEPELTAEDYPQQRPCTQTRPDRTGKVRSKPTRQKGGGR